MARKKFSKKTKSRESYSSHRIAAAQKNLQKDFPLLHLWMQELKTWCNEPGTRDARTERKNAIAEHIGVQPQTIKSMYNYGHGPIKNWLRAMDKISRMKQSEVVQIHYSFPHIKKKLNVLSPQEMAMHKNIARMSEAELETVNKLIEVGLVANKKQKKKR